MMMNRLHWRLSSSWIPEREGGASSLTLSHTQGFDLGGNLGRIVVRNSQESLQKGLYAKARLQFFFSFRFSPVEGHFPTSSGC